MEKGGMEWGRDDVTEVTRNFFRQLILSDLYLKRLLPLVANISIRVYISGLMLEGHRHTSLADEIWWNRLLLSISSNN
jgi:hypothetical protein